MSSDYTTIARPYAEAAFEVAQANKALDTWSGALQLLAGIVADERIDAALTNPNVPRAELERLILSVAGDGLPLELQNLVHLLSVNGRLPVLPELARLFEEQKVAADGIRHIIVRSAFAMSEADAAALKETLKGHFGATVELTVEDDPSLIGGVQIRADDVVIDGSIRGRLQQLSNTLHF
jgi:F-type H+-transporting ATPase subunit delta